MTRKQISEVISNINQKHILEAADNVVTPKTSSFSWVKWSSLAACLCLLVCGIFMARNNLAPPPVGGDNPSIVDTHYRGPSEETTSNETTNHSTNPSVSSQVAKKINVYKTESLDLDIKKIAEFQNNLESAGWAQTECTLNNEYGFNLKGTINNVQKKPGAEDCKKLAEEFMKDSGLIVHLGKYGVFDFEYESSVGDGFIVTYCYFMCDGEKTGAYIRFIFEGYKHVGEVQAHIYSSECIDILPLLSLEDALKSAYSLNEGKLEKVNAEDFRIQNTKLVYINGLPYYRFDGFGINTRLFINGFALAIDVNTSSIPDQLISQHQAFKFE
ncbi:MAG: hypothetical protein IJE78_09925 [Bacteroidaceae bacterium]|nr:hypothetical protein [Bacteroidaceae bacterium]